MTAPSTMRTTPPPRRYVHQHSDGFIRVTKCGTGVIITEVTAVSFHYEDPSEAEAHIARRSS